MSERKEVRYSKGALDEFCSTVREVEKDKDRVLEASHLQRQERQPMFTSGQMLSVLLLIAVAVIGTVGAACMTFAGEAAYALAVVGATLFVLTFVGIIVCE